LSCVGIASAIVVILISIASVLLLSSAGILFRRLLWFLLVTFLIKFSFVQGYDVCDWSCEFLIMRILDRANSESLKFLYTFSAGRWLYDISFFISFFYGWYEKHNGKVLRIT